MSKYIKKSRLIAISNFLKGAPNRELIEQELIKGELSKREIYEAFKRDDTIRIVLKPGVSEYIEGIKKEYELSQNKPIKKTKKKIEIKNEQKELPIIKKEDEITLNETKKIDNDYNKDNKKINDDIKCGVDEEDKFNKLYLIIPVLLIAGFFIMK